MLIYDENKQIKRAEAIIALLEIEELSPWAKTFWQSTLQRLSRSQVQLEYAYNKTTSDA
jgi:hypothetical protein|tara:strand:- start:984 stop:1160 length:177 start_codon:yes stop_codon:yes gene_type:complete